MKPGDFYPMWSEARSMPFRRSPYPTSTFEMAVGRADAELTKEAILGTKASSLLQVLRAYIHLEDQRPAGYQWTPVGGAWLEPHELADKEDVWQGRSAVSRTQFAEFWEGKVAPYLNALHHQTEGEGS